MDHSFKINVLTITEQQSPLDERQSYVGVLSARSWTIQMFYYCLINYTPFFISGNLLSCLQKASTGAVVYKMFTKCMPNTWEIGRYSPHVNLEEFFFSCLKDIEMNMSAK